MDGEVGHTRAVRNWVLVSAAAAPVALIGGWTLAQTRQSAGFDPVTDTISALAARGADDRWIMTVGLFVLGVCHVVTAAGLTEAAPAGRILLALGGAATLVVAASPQPAAAHIPAAAVSFGALALWPAFSGLPDRRSGIIATTVMLVLLGWLGAELRDGNQLGLSERLLAGFQALWPLLVALVIVRSRRRVQSEGPRHTGNPRRRVVTLGGTGWAGTLGRLGAALDSPAGFDPRLPTRRVNTKPTRPIGAPRHVRHVTCRAPAWVGPSAGGPRR